MKRLRFLFKWVCVPRMAKMTLKKEFYYIYNIINFKLKCQD